LSLQALQERIREAAGRGTALRLRGGGSKDFYGNAPRGEILDTRGYAGIIDYEPTELVVTARCGTSLAELEHTLQVKGQFLPFEPPHFGPGATLGGCVASGLSGPGRASAGALRDYLLGTKLIDGRGDLLSFGGQVMKNVAGYDVSRLLAGSLGTLGLIAEASIKVLPRPPAEATLRLKMSEEQALDSMNRWAGQPLPLSASAWHDGELALRLSGSQAGVTAAAAKIGGDVVPQAQAVPFWQGVREQSDPFFAGEDPLWRVAVPSATPALRLPGRQMIEWGGGVRWFKSGAEVAVMREAAQRARGHATLFRVARRSGEAFSPLDPVPMRLHREMKAAFDPAGILNPGRLYAQL
jgi:glycolate oxidase FAD binding subunit